MGKHSVDGKREKFVDYGEFHHFAMDNTLFERRSVVFRLTDNQHLLRLTISQSAEDLGLVRMCITIKVVITASKGSIIWWLPTFTCVSLLSLQRNGGFG